MVEEGNSNLFDEKRFFTFASMSIISSCCSELLGMKQDMGGAAAVLSAFNVLVKSGFKQNLHCILCIAENMISPYAMYVSLLC